MPRFFAVEFKLGGRTYAGTWSLRQGGIVCVGCFWGADRAEVGALKPEVAAQRLLEKIVRADLKRRAKELERYERERAKLHRSAKHRSPST